MLAFGPRSCTATRLARSGKHFRAFTSHKANQCRRCESRVATAHRRHTQRPRHTPAALGSSGQPPEDIYSDIYSDITEQMPPSEEYEGPQLVRMDELQEGLGGTSDGVFGELAVLLVGFTKAEFDAFRGMMNSMEADFVKLVPCTLAMLDGTLETAVAGPPPAGYQQLPAGTRRAVIMSGMSTAEVMEVIGAYSEIDALPETLFGAAVPKNYERNLRMLLAEMYDDKEWRAEQDRLGAEEAAQQG